MERSGRPGGPIMTTVYELFHHAGVHYSGAVPWGDEVPFEGPGVYVVSTNANPNDGAGLTECPLNLAAVMSLLAVRPEATIDGEEADAHKVADRLRTMWPAEESVVYVGLAGTSTRERVFQFYGTPIGARAPHAGGWAIKMLDTARLWVHYGPTHVPAIAEAAMVDRFVEGIAVDVRRTLIDPSAPLPFANLAFPGGRRKNHGFRGVKSPKNGSADRKNDKLDQPPTSPLHAGGEGGAVVAISHRTQNLTESDLAAGNIRIPQVSKSLFPESKADIQLELGGETHMASWDPRAAGDKERSGVIGIGRGVLKRHMSAGGPRSIKRTASGYRFS